MHVIKMWVHWARFITPLWSGWWSRKMCLTLGCCYSSLFIIMSIYYCLWLFKWHLRDLDCFPASWDSLASGLLRSIVFSVTHVLGKLCKTSLSLISPPAASTSHQPPPASCSTPRQAAHVVSELHQYLPSVLHLLFSHTTEFSVWKFSIFFFTVQKPCSLVYLPLGSWNSPWKSQQCVLDPTQIFVP